LIVPQIPKASSLKKLYGMAYVGILNGLDEMLKESETELTLEHFNLQLPYAESLDNEETVE
jgi:hypothetical protein